MTGLDLDVIRERWRALADVADDQDLTFDAFARRSASDVPALLAEVDRLRAENTRLANLARCCSQDPGHDGPCAWDCAVCSGAGSCPDCSPAAMLSDPCETCEGTGDCPSGCVDGRFVDVHGGRPVETARVRTGAL